LPLLLFGFRRWSPPREGIVFRIEGAASGGKYVVDTRFEYLF
jgi:hypothetical protein